MHGATHLPHLLFLFPGSTALHLATISCQPQCVKVLLQVRATPWYYSCEGKKWIQGFLTLSWSHKQYLIKYTHLITNMRACNNLFINSQHLFNIYYVQAPHLMLPLRAGHKVELPVNMHILSTATGRATSKTNCCDGDGWAEGGQRFSN